jgi:hypothetical protein
MNKAQSSNMRTGGIVAVSAVLVLLLGSATEAVTISADFNDGTYGAHLDTLVDMSPGETINTTIAAKATTGGGTDLGLTDDDNEFYATGYGYANGKDRALIDTDSTFGDVVVTAVAGINDNSNTGQAAAGVVAGVPTGGGSGYLLYVVGTWGSSSYGAGRYRSDTEDLLQLVLARMDDGNGSPLTDAVLSDTANADALGPYENVPNFLQLTVDGTSVTGKAWLNQSDDSGDADLEVSFTDNNPLSGHAGVFVVHGYYGASPPSATGTNWGVAAVDDFEATEVPEPATLLLLGLGGLFGLAGRHRG